MSKNKLDFLNINGVKVSLLHQDKGLCQSYELQNFDCQVVKTSLLMSKHHIVSVFFTDECKNIHEIEATGTVMNNNQFLSFTEIFKNDKGLFQINTKSGELYFVQHSKNHHFTIWKVYVVIGPNDVVSLGHEKVEGGYCVICEDKIKIVSSASSWPELDVFVRAFYSKYLPVKCVNDKEAQKYVFSNHPIIMQPSYNS